MIIESTYKKATMKRKIKNVLGSACYCSICFEKIDAENLCSVDAEFEIVVNKLNGKQSYISYSLQEIIQGIFNEISIPAGEHVCQQCIDQILSIFKFIKATKESAKELTKYLNDLNTKVDDLNCTLDPSQNYNSSKVVIVLENLTEVPSQDKHRKTATLKNNNTYITKNEPYIKERSRGIKKENHLKDKQIKHLPISKRVIKKKNIYLEHEQCMQRKTIPKCKICSKIFVNHSILTQHYKVHSKLKCKICDLLVPDTEFNDHLKLNHEDETYFCLYCDMIYYTSVALVAHLKISHSTGKKFDIKDESPQCLLCLQYFDKKEIETHKCKGRCPDCTDLICIHYKYLISFTEQKLNHCNKVKCIDCDYVCRKKEVLLVHVNKEHLNHHPFTCGHCGVQYHSKDLLKRHIVRNHMVQLICNFCDKPFLSALALEAHISTCQLITREFECAYCQASFNSSTEFASHEKLRHSSENYPCNKCNRKFLTEETLISHTKRSHRSVQVTRKRQSWLCGLCEKSFATKGECVQHRRTHDPNDKYKCHKCDIEFESRKYLQWHNRIHKEKKDLRPEKCPICGKEVKYLTPHLRLHRVTDKPLSFVCEQCGKLFATNSMLKSHGLVHLNHIQCKICKKHVKPSTMAHHIKLHEVKEKGKLKTVKKVIKKTKPVKPISKCEYCDYFPLTAQRLEAHMNRYHLNIKPYKCNICSDSFCVKEYLKMHMRVHSDEKKFTCEICKNKFRFKSCLAKHMLLHTGEKPFVCDICADGFTSSSSLKEHRLKHFEKTIVCPLCSMSFHSVRNMRHHFKKQHWKQKGKKFNPKELVGEEYHYLFEDRRKVNLET